MKKWIYIVTVACCFGPSFLFIKVAVREVSPFTLVSARIFIGAILLYLFLKIQRKSIRPYFYLWKHFIIAGAFSTFIPFLLISYGEKEISSGLTGIINGSVPIFTAVLAHHFLPNDKVTLGKILGISSGIIGLFVIFAPTLFKEQLGSLLGMGMVVIASIFYAMGTIYMKKHLQNLPPLVAPTGQLFFTSLLLFPAALILSLSSPLLLPSWQVIGSIIGLGFLGTFLAFILYYKILQIASATELSYSALIFPVIALLLGTIFLQEQLRWNIYLGAFFILLGLKLSTFKSLSFPLLAREK